MLLIITMNLLYMTTVEVLTSFRHFNIPYQNSNILLQLFMSFAVMVLNKNPSCYNLN